MSQYKESVLIFFLILIITLNIQCYGKVNMVKHGSIENEILDKVNLRSDPFLVIKTKSFNNINHLERDVVSPEVISPLEETCSSNLILNHITSLKKKVSCKPRETLVDLLTEEHLYIEPKAVLVKRCRGVCNKKFKCLPSKVVEKKIYLKQFLNGEIICISVTVPEHEKCKCRCEQLQSECNRNQIYDQNNCTCVCKNQVQFECHNKGYKFDYETCSCKCDEKYCSTGTVWDSTTCRCVIENYVQNFDAYVRYNIV